MKKVYISGLFCLALLIACGSPDKTEENVANEKPVATETNDVQLTAAQVKNAGIEIGALEAKNIHKTIHVNGVVDVPPENTYSVSVPLGGYVRQMTLIPGMYVKKGSVLAVVEDQQYIQLQQDYLTAKNRLKFTADDYTRQKGLNQTKATSDKIFQQVESDFNNQKVSVNGLAEKLRLIGINPASLNEHNITRNIRVYAPISGYITEVNTNTGKYANPTDVLFEVINPGGYHVNLTVFEGDAANLRVGQEITCSTSSNPNKRYIAKVHLIKPSIADDRTTSVHCDLEGGDDLLPGTFLNATISLAASSADAAPDEAIVKWENKNYVFAALGNNNYKMIPVETGTSLDGFTEIKTSEKLGNIVVKNAYAVLMKMKNAGE
ncbi:efflux RND transporter periplasmic adaptor subunit [Pedobacter duraquae]|uniref:Cobalt-zinc-cadmium efflux system membrane fusion protein n=1 Tax=Pedobacter duraquae TaxID=425511 RepID=A0A4R6ID75_9SPHI|nr:efflux RND transporter periplasmic adaptor subunit [Pedobacter duraquae]TDO20213.1 cobalt-zinc-cadmium efflux system membrane fusion protein [Pedobacter duraquae]